MFINLNKRLKLKKFVVIDEVFDNSSFINDNSLFINDNFNREISLSKKNFNQFKKSHIDINFKFNNEFIYHTKKNVVVCVYRRFVKLKFFA